MQKFEFESYHAWSQFIEIYWPLYSEDTEYDSDEFQEVFRVGGKIRALWNHMEMYGVVKL